MIDYTKINSETWDSWAEDGCEYTLPISHEKYEKITADNFSVILTPCISVPHEWFGDLNGKKVLGLASGGGQHITDTHSINISDYANQYIKGCFLRVHPKKIGKAGLKKVQSIIFYSLMINLLPAVPLKDTLMPHGKLLM